MLQRDSRGRFVSSKKSAEIKKKIQEENLGLFATSLLMACIGTIIGLVIGYIIFIGKNS